MELLAPAGNPESLKAAIYSGANAVYFGLNKFNARINANNFNKENVREYIELCHLHGVKAYITFNTIIKDNEFEEFEESVKVAAEAKADAFIVTDLGALSIFSKYDVPLHASTQMGIHNLDGAKFVEKLGFTRVVVSRETLFDDIKEIKENTSLEVEYFVHGALCVSFSGGENNKAKLIHKSCLLWKMVFIIFLNDTLFSSCASTSSLGASLTVNVTIN